MCVPCPGHTSSRTTRASARQPVSRWDPRRLRARAHRLDQLVPWQERCAARTIRVQYEPCGRSSRREDTAPENGAHNRLRHNQLLWRQCECAADSVSPQLRNAIPPESKNDVWQRCNAQESCFSEVRSKQTVTSNSCVATASDLAVWPLHSRFFRVPLDFSTR